MTIDEFNQVNGADNIEMKNSIVVIEKLNLKLYAALSVVLFLFVGCFCAIFMGRLGDFVDYYLYVDKKSGLPNRERCDAAIDHYSTTRLKGQFTIIYIQLDFSAMSRNDGDKALRLLGDQLQYVFRTLGFVGYNGAGHFIVLLENCSFNLAKNCVNRLGSLLAKTEFARFGPCIFVGIANSAKDNAYEIRALLRLSIRRCADAKARQEAENAKNAAASPLVSKKLRVNYDKKDTAFSGTAAAHVLLMALVLGSILLYNLQMNKSFITTFYTVTVDKPVEDLRIVLLSDLHLSEYGDRQRRPCAEGAQPCARPHRSGGRHGY